MSLHNLADLFYDELRDILSAERQLLRGLQKMGKTAANDKLKHAFEQHRSETEKQIERLEQAFAETGKSARAKECEAMKGLIEEANSMMQETAESEVMDAALIAMAQKIEHYEIASYGTLCTWAKQLGYDQALKLLEQTKAEEERTDKLLSELAEHINQAANA
jgi:ferritin-like metal-binding protein YciE